MARRFYNLPPLTTLSAFETSARHNSFKKAAMELGVTPGAVSHQIKSLEKDLGIVLFERNYRGVQITTEGQLLFSSLQQSFSTISKTIQAIRPSDEKDTISIAATTAMSALWLTPKLTQFWKPHSDINVDQHVSDAFDHTHENPDLRIIYGYPRAENTALQADILFQDELVAVCSPDFYLLQTTFNLPAIATMPLIHLRSKDERWTTWREWFEKAGYQGSINNKIHVNNYMIALQMACEGAGVVIGWKHLLKPMIDKKELVILGDTVVPAPMAFHLLSSKNSHLNKNIRILKDYLLSFD